MPAHTSLKPVNTHTHTAKTYVEVEPLDAIGRAGAHHGEASDEGRRDREPKEDGGENQRE